MTDAYHTDQDLDIANTTTYHREEKQSSRSLASHDIRFWATKLWESEPPASIDSQSPDEVVKSLQTLLESGNEREAWAMIAAMAAQLQRARRTLKKIVPATLSIARNAKKLTPGRIKRSQSTLPPPPSHPPLNNQNHLQNWPVAAGRIDDTLAAMRRFPAEAKLQERACRTLVDSLRANAISAKSAESKQDADYETVVWICSSCRESNTCAVNTCKSCGKAGDGSANDQFNTTQFEDEEDSFLDVAGAALEAMRNCPQQAAVQREACALLAAVSHHHETLVSRVVAQGGLDLLLKAMSSLKGDCTLHTHALGVLANPAVADDAVVRVDAPNLRKAILRALFRFQTDAVIPALALLGLANLAVKDDQTIVFLLEHRVDQTVIELLTMTANRRNANLVAAALWLLSTLAYPRSGAEDAVDMLLARLRQPHARNVIEQVRRANSEHRSVKSYTKALLARLDDDGQSDIDFEAIASGVHDQQHDNGQSKCVLQ